ncbi:hypothetical protein Micbo1qcDRAFT_121333 [Microdochium bolleyi]|uniref:LysM domain-containing protein n=1 Tax=Microdochium bolleyi TaxID=196109 RepID=A0A136IYM4_9PEZI|nr:hypothetical protein Micbo1qcDRAFT_121333 [Microdochium bolleyi]
MGNSWTTSPRAILASIALLGGFQLVSGTPFPVQTGNGAVLGSRAEKPKMPTDPNTYSGCIWWFDNDGSKTCSELIRSWAVKERDFILWNPSITEGCGNFITGRSYCIEAGISAPPEEPTSSSSSVRPTSTTTTAEPTRPTNGIETPSPLHPGLVSNCDQFYMVKQGDSCAAITAEFGITQQQLAEWNPTVGDSCGGLWADTWACVHTIGLVVTTQKTMAPTTTKPTTTITSAGNGIKTPSPLQPGLVNNCDKFYMVKAGDTCAAIAAQHGITQAEFELWNPKTGDACTNIWADTWACVHIIGLPTTTNKPTTTTKPPATTTTPSGNGIKTPSPVQPSMVANCDKFDMVQAGDTCAAIAAKNGITVSRLQAWNKGLKTDCSGLWANAWACVHTIGYESATKETCATSGKGWGGNKAAARTRVTYWCDGQDKSDGVGGYATAQTKKGCFDLPDGSSKAEFWARNDFGIGTKLSLELCNEIVRVPINSCELGGTAVHEGWWVK